MARLPGCGVWTRRCVQLVLKRARASSTKSLWRGTIRTLNTNVYVVLLRLLYLAGIFIRFRERVKSLEILDGHTRAGESALEVGVLGCARVGVSVFLLRIVAKLSGSRDLFMLVVLWK
jgi:hypothetical protein